MKLNCSNLPIDLKPELQRFLHAQIKHLELDSEDNQLYQRLHGDRGTGYIVKLDKDDNGDVFITALIGVHMIFDVVRASTISTGLMHQSFEHSLYVSESGQSSKAFFTQWQNDVLRDLKKYGLQWDFNMPLLMFNEAVADIYAELKNQLLISTTCAAHQKKMPIKHNGLVRVV